jgi:hypothetical protein
MLHAFGNLDNELTVPVGQLPSGVQVQALEMALTGRTLKLKQLVSMLKTPVPGIGVAPQQGLSPAWKKRIQIQVKYLSELWAGVMNRANRVASGDAGDAIVQGSLASNWNRWAPTALQVYGEAINAFHGEVDRAMSNKPVAGTPAAYMKMASVLKVPPPKLPDVVSVR